jgi:hypothetical protein
VTLPPGCWQPSRWQSPQGSFVAPAGFEGLHVARRPGWRERKRRDTLDGERLLANEWRRGSLDAAHDAALVTCDLRSPSVEQGR